MRSGPVHWCGSLDEVAAGPTVAWVFSLAAADAAARSGLRPTDSDLRDLNGRGGDAARRFLARRSVLRHLVARRCGVDPETVGIGYGADGQPLLLAPADAPSCSASARGDWTALALSDDPVGIDIEPVEPGAIAWPALAGEEADSLRALDAGDQPAAFLRIWTLKEAYLKALGTGLLRDPAAIAVSLAPNPTLRDAASTLALDDSAAQRCRIASQEIVGACVSLPGRGLR